MKDVERGVEPASAIGVRFPRSGVRWGASGVGNSGSGNIGPASVRGGRLSWLLRLVTNFSARSSAASVHQNGKSTRSKSNASQSDRNTGSRRPETERRPKRSLAALTALLLLSACTPRSIETGDLLISLSRDGNCFNCPWYSVSIFANGQIKFKGIAGTVAHGERFAFLDHDTLESLAADILQLRFFSRQDRYDTRKFFDGSTTTLDVRFGGMHKKVIDHYGAPDSVHAIERRIDQLSGANFWIGGGSEPPNPNSREARQHRHEIDSLEAIDDEMLQQYQALRDKGDVRQAFHLFHEERKLSDSINKAYEFFTGMPADTTSRRKQTR